MVRKFILLLSCFLCITSVAYAGVFQFVFTTPVQTILPSTLSAPMTMQSQNDSGLQESVTETYDFSFRSTSPTGQFLSSTGKTISKTMSKGTANRTFYYSDTTLGTYTLTVTATGRTSKKSFTATQQITVASTLPVKPTPVVIKTPPKTATKTSAKTKVSTVSVAQMSPQLSDHQTPSSSEISSTSAVNVATVYEGVKETSVFDSLFDWPGNFWKWLVHLL